MSVLKHSNKPVLFIFVGIPSSGKTTLAKFLEKKLPAIRVSSDEIKVALFGKSGYDLNAIFDCQHQILKNLAPTDFHLISDANSAKKEYREKLVELAKKNSRKAIIVFCKISAAKASQRMKLRKGKKFYSSREQIAEYLKELEIPERAIVIDTGVLNLSQSKKALWDSLKSYE